MAEKPTTIDQYLAGFPDDVVAILQRVRRVLGDAIPDSPESISYGIPSIRIRGRYALYFAAWKNHLGIYPVSRGDADYEAAVGPFRAAKDSLHFPYAKPIPYELIERVARAEAQRRNAQE